MVTTTENFKMKIKAVTAFALMLALIPALSSAAVHIEGVSFPRSVMVDNTKMQLRGHGLLRYLVVIKAYVGALYLPEPAEATDVLEPVAKRLELEYFHAIGKEDFSKATRMKIQDNVTPEESERIRDRLEAFVGLYQSVEPGDRYALTYIPGVGTELALNGKPLGTIAGSDFARAVFAIWLGPNPIDTGFRDALMGMS
jgi:hypothetical protein